MPKREPRLPLDPLREEYVVDETHCSCTDSGSKKHGAGELLRSSLERVWVAEFSVDKVERWREFGAKKVLEDNALALPGSPSLSDLLECTRNAHCSAPLRGAESSVTAAHREAVCFTNSRDPHDLNWKGEVKRHPLDDRELLKVFLPEEGCAAPAHHQKLEDDGTDPLKMPWPIGTAERLGEGPHTDPRL